MQSIGIQTMLESLHSFGKSSRGTDVAMMWKNIEHWFLLSEIMIQWSILASHLLAKNHHSTRQSSVYVFQLSLCLKLDRRFFLSRSVVRNENNFFFIFKIFGVKRINCQVKNVFLFVYWTTYLSKEQINGFEWFKLLEQLVMESLWWDLVNLLLVRYFNCFWNIACCPFVVLFLARIPRSGASLQLKNTAYCSSTHDIINGTS